MTELIFYFPNYIIESRLELDPKEKYEIGYLSKVDTFKRTIIRLKPKNSKGPGTHALITTFPIVDETKEFLEITSKKELGKRGVYSSNDIFDSETELNYRILGLRGIEELTTINSRIIIEDCVIDVLVGFGEEFTIDDILKKIADFKRNITMRRYIYKKTKAEDSFINMNTELYGVPENETLRKNGIFCKETNFMSISFGDNIPQITDPIKGMTKVLGDLTLFQEFFVDYDFEKYDCVFYEVINTPYDSFYLIYSVKDLASGVVRYGYLMTIGMDKYTIRHIMKQTLDI